MEQTKKLLESIKTYLCTGIAAENAKHSDELRKHQQLVDAQVYEQAYLEKDLAKESDRHNTALAGYRQKAADALNRLYNLLTTEKPDILGRDFQYAHTLAQTLGDSMTHEQVVQAITPLRGRITTLDVLRQAYDRLGAPITAFSDFTFYEPAKDIIPMQTTETVFKEAERQILYGASFDACVCVKQIANKLLGQGVMEFPPNFDREVTVPGVVSGLM